MKRIFFAAGLILCTTVATFSQDKGYIAISAGPSIPIGKFAGQGLVANEVTWARLGAMCDISLGYKLNKNFGIAVLIRGQKNETDSEEFIVSYSNFSIINSSVKSDSWRLGALMGGSYGSFPVSERLSVECRLMFGVLLARSPEIDIIYGLAAGLGAIESKQESSTSAALGYLMGVGLKYDVARRVCLLVNGDYFGGNAEFRNVSVMVPAFMGGGTNTFSQSFSTINVSAGIGFRL